MQCLHSVAWSQGVALVQAVVEEAQIVVVVASVEAVEVHQDYPECNERQV